jgi:hypothetical protein
MKKIVISLILVLGVVLTFILCWGAGRGTSGGVVLRYPVGARAIGMGGGFVAVSDDGSAAYWNPAGLTYLTKKELLLFYLEGMADTNYGFVGYTIPTKIGTWGVSIASLQAGKAEIYSLIQPTREVIAQSDYVGTISYANKLASVLSLGLNIKALQSELAEQEKASAYAVDAGLLYETPLPNLFLGIVGQNMGGKIQYISEADPLPVTAKIGIAYTVFVQSHSEEFSYDLSTKGTTQVTTSNHAITIAVDEEKPNDDGYKTNIGLEYWYNEVFSVRGGYKLGRDSENYSMGLGFIYGAIGFDYAYAPVKDLESDHRISLLIRF